MPTPSSPTVGLPAPNFILYDEKGERVALADYKGKKNVVLIFYPGDMTPGCTMQLCAIRDDWSKFVRQDMVVFGINHGEPKSHANFSKKYALPFSLLVDKGKKVSAKYGAIRTIFKTEVIKRSVVVVDKQGIIVYLKRGMPKNIDILKAITIC